MPLFLNNQKLVEETFSLEKDFEKLVFDNYRTFFGKHCILLNTKTLIEGKTLGGTIPDGILFDFTDKTDPKFYLVEVELCRHSFNAHIFPQITKFFAFFKNKDQQDKLAEKLHFLIKESRELSSTFSDMIGNAELYKFITGTIKNNQNVLLITDGEKSEVEEVSEVYSETWGKMLKHIIVRRYSGSDTYLYSVEPDYEILQTVGDSTSKIVNEAFDESFHFEGIPDAVIGLYKSLKNGISEAFPELIFNPTKGYISIRSSKNIAFIQIQKKRVKFIPLVSEDTILHKIKSHHVVTLGDTVKKFWGGDCAHIFIEDSNNLEEIYELMSDVSSQK